MRYGFINNFAQALSGELAQGATSMTLDDNGALLDNASEDMVYTLTLFDVTSGENEIVHVTAADGNDLTVGRGQEGTTDRTWPTGTQVEMRLTAGAAGLLTNIYFGDESVALGGGATLSSTAAGNIAVGQDAQAGQNLGISIGKTAEVKSPRCVAVGHEASIDEDSSDTVAVGIGATASKDCRDSVLIGTYAGLYPVDTDAEACVVIGSYSEAYQRNTTALGTFNYSSPDHAGATSIGAYVVSQNRYTTALGTFSFTTEAESAAIGAGSRSDVAGGLHMRALGYLPKDVEDVIGMNQPPILAEAPNATRRAAQVNVVATDAIDLADANASFTLDLPDNTIFLTDAIDVVIVEADGAGGDPEIIVGPDDQDPDDYLAATPVTKTEVGGRETHDPLVSDGVTSLRVAVDTAGTGTYKAKVIFRGYVMEV